MPRLSDFAFLASGNDHEEAHRFELEKGKEMAAEYRLVNREGKTLCPESWCRAAGFTQDQSQSREIELCNEVAVRRRRDGDVELREDCSEP
ncbi:hypothetical protein R1flu_003596 [Riccia fluitans]|uniref:Uncharacterized protein n=1 Tax=Riccia fluitans TaxID=41844 RepID=A0ABD1Y9G1_9MARC